jgi:hypothetical protein
MGIHTDIPIGIDIGSFQTLIGGGGSSRGGRFIGNGVLNSREFLMIQIEVRLETGHVHELASTLRIRVAINVLFKHNVNVSVRLLWGWGLGWHVAVITNNVVSVLVLVLVLVLILILMIRMMMMMVVVAMMRTNVWEDFRFIPGAGAGGPGVQVTMMMLAPHRHCGRHGQIDGPWIHIMVMVIMSGIGVVIVLKIVMKIVGGRC